MMIDEYTLLKSIGKGAFGEVYMTSKEGTNKLFATKKISKQKISSPTLKKYFLNEILILKEIKHKNIIHYEAVKHTVHNFYLITEYCNGGGLSDCLEKYKKIYGRPFSELVVQHIMRQIVDALKYLHGKRIIHRDIKLDNILVNFENENDKSNMNMLKAQIKMIDFGFATHLGNKNLRYSTLGSPINMDPILLKKLATKSNAANLIGYDEKADIWSLGTVCYEMLIGQGVFNAENMRDLIKKVELGTYHVPTNLSKEVVSFLNGMLQYNAKKRLSAEELSRHHFLTKNIKEFKNIDLNQVSSKIDEKGLNINIKRNQTIWAIFKEEDEKTLIDIPGKYLMGASPIVETDESPQRIDNPFKMVNNKTNNIVNNMINKNNNNLNINNNPNYNNVININNNKKANYITNNIKNTKITTNIKSNNINYNNHLKTKEKNIDYNLLKQQQKLYYQLNLKNNNYHRFANYNYNNPYGFGTVNNNNNISNNYYDNQPIYYNANLNGNDQINSQPQNPIQGIPSANNNITKLNQQSPQYKYINNNQPQFIIQNNEIIPNPLYNQPSPQVPTKIQNMQPQKQVNIPEINKEDLNKLNKKHSSKLSEFSNTTTITVPVGSRMPQQLNPYGSPPQKIINLETPQQKNIYYQSPKIIQIPIQNNHSKPIIKKLKSQDYDKQEKQISAQFQQKNLQEGKLDRKNGKTFQEKEKNYIPKCGSVQMPKNNEIQKKNRLNNQEELAPIKEQEPKNSQKNINNYNDNKHENSNKLPNKNRAKTIDNKKEEQKPKMEEKSIIPLDSEEEDNDDKKNNNKRDDDVFNEPFPMPSDEEFSPEKKNSKNIDSGDDLDNLIDFKLGDELVCEPESTAKKKSNEIQDNEDDNNMDLPMKKIMERTVERPTIGVPSPGSNPNDNDEDDDNGNGIFQSGLKKDFENYDEI